MRRFATLFALIICCAILLTAKLTSANSTVPSTNYTECTSQRIAVPQQGETGDLTLPSPTETSIDESNTTPADDATIAAITVPVVQSLACQNAGDVLRTLANFSDRWIAERFSGYDLVFYGRFLQSVNAATPVPDDGQVSLVSIDNVRLRADGAVLATVATTVNGQDQTSLLVLVNTVSGWKIDHSQPIP